MIMPRPAWWRGRSRCGPTARTAAGPVTENGWMVLPEFKGRGLAKRAVRMPPELARDDGRCGLVHAFPVATKAPSNGIRRSPGFRYACEQDVIFAGHILPSNRQVIDPAADPA